MGAMRNVKTVRIIDKSILTVPMTLLSSDAKVSGSLSGVASPVAFVINHNTDNTLATLRFKLKDVAMNAAEETFKVGEQLFNAGSFIIKAQGNPGDLKQRLESAVTSLGLKAIGVDKVPEVKSHAISVPRIAIVHTWINTQNEGWFRIEFDRLQIPYTYISDQVLGRTPNLREKFDVIIFPPVGGSAQTIVNGIPKRGEPIPWKASALTPSFGSSPDQSDDIRGGMGVVGIANLQKFVEEGGLFITIGGISQIPIDYGITNGVSIQAADKLQARGSIYNANFSDRRSPIAYGYDQSLTIYFSQSPLFQVAAGGGGGFGGGGGGGQGGGQGAGRASGRGGVADPDIIQAMPQPKPPDPDRPGGEQSLQEQRESPFFTPQELRPRVIMRFASDEKNLLVSGMLAGGSELANRPAIVDVPVGRGHVVMFATNPMWRHQTQGEFFLLFNAALNYDNLGVGRSEARPQGPRPATADEDQ
jgi:hypothetical protein